METVATLMGRLEQDRWRSRVGFSEEMETFLQRTENQQSSKDEIIEALDAWLSSNHQPCLFGRIAAKQRLIAYCLLTEADLALPDEKIREKIQADRLAWTRLGYEGRSSGFIIVLLSRALARAVPNDTVQQLALRIGFLYLMDEIAPDEIYLDRVYLEQPGAKRTAWEWVAGVNYFSAQGDKRWWQDHRFPAGLAFSVNSVGHMAKSGKLIQAMHHLEHAMGTASDDFTIPKVDSLEKALGIAMRTIDLASMGPSGKATYLIPLPEDRSSLPRCPIDLPRGLEGKNYAEYRGHYHTDYTVPSEYFVPEVERPTSTHLHHLDFTYLFDERLDNPDFHVVGQGRAIREATSGRAQETADADAYPYDKRLRGSEVLVEIDDVDRLRAALDRSE